MDGRADAEASTRYRVTAPYVTVRTGTLGGPAGLHGFHRDALLPWDVSGEDVARLVRKGLVEEVEGDGSAVA